MFPSVFDANFANEFWTQAPPLIARILHRAHEDCLSEVINQRHSELVDHYHFEFEQPGILRKFLNHAKETVGTLPIHQTASPISWLPQELLLQILTKTGLSLQDQLRFTTTNKHHFHLRASPQLGLAAVLEKSLYSPKAEEAYKRRKAIESVQKTVASVNQCIDRVNSQRSPSPDLTKLKAYYAAKFL